LEKRFFKTFSAENSIFSQHFGGKISAEFSPKFSLEKMYEKSAPGANPTIASYNASVVKIYSAVNSMAR
jgi:hypothetical protein